MTKRRPSVSKSPFSRRQPREKTCAPGFHHEYVDAISPGYEVCKHCSFPRKKGY